MEFVKNWCEGIIIAVVISILIEMIVPEGTNKKYVKVVTGIYIIFVILNPIIGNLNKDINFFNNFKTIEVASVMSKEQDIKKVYINAIKSSMEEDIRMQGFNVLSLEIIYDNNYENIEKVHLSIEENERENRVSNIEKIEIGIQEEKKTNTINNEKKKILKDLISENYNISEDNILIN